MKIFAADDAAWRRMFLVAAVPGLFYSLGALFLKESPRWLMRRGRTAEAEAVLRLSLSVKQTALEIEEMRQHADKREATGGARDSLLQRKYVVPFVLACIVLACTQATGINSIIAYSTRIFQGARMSNVQAFRSSLIIMTLNCVMTLVGAVLVDRVGRKRLLTFGTAGIIIALLSTGFVYRQFESRRVDVTNKVAADVSANGRELSINVAAVRPEKTAVVGPAQLSVLYCYGDGKGYHRQVVASAFSNARKAQGRTWTIRPLMNEKFKTLSDGKMVIERSERDKAG